MPRQPRYIYEFGPFRLDLEERQLRRGETLLALMPKAFETLSALIENSRHIVTKDELMNRVWPGIFVEETNLAQHISLLRKALGEREDGGQYIETVPKRGYRFTVPVKKIKQLPTQVSGEISAKAAPEAGKAAAGLTELAATNASDNPITNNEPLSSVGQGTRLGRYEIIKQLGAGGMGEVYLAHDLALDRKVALKLLSSRYTENTTWLRRFVREAKAASALNHPNIITIHEIGEASGVHFIATEYIEGQTLRQHISSGPLKLPQALNIAAQVASALSAAHATGLVHRDVKPENLILRPDGYIKVLDFGLAKYTDHQKNKMRTSQFQTDPGVVMGTVNYMSPEQARGLTVDTRSDVFSLGVVLYEMLAGHAPFQGATPSDVIVAILDREPLRLSQTLRGAPTELERIVGKALRKDRDERYQTIKDFQLDLKSLQQELEMQVKYGEALARDTASRGAQHEQAREYKTTRKQLRADTASIPAGHTTGEQKIPTVRYARSGEVNIAYQVVGAAPLDLVFVMGWISHLEYFWSEPSFARFLRRLAGFARVILFDKRGTGLSDRVPLDQLPTLELRMDDVRAVMDAVGSQRAVLCGVSEGGPMCSLFAATYPEKTIALVMVGSYARRLRGEGYPWGPTEADHELFFEEIRQHWGGPVGLEERAPSKAHDQRFRDWWAAYLRRGASPGAALALTRMNTEIDIRHVLPNVRVPTLVIHRTGDECLKVEEGRYLAEHISGAKFVELPGVDHLPFVGEQDEILDEIEEFLTGMRHAPEADRVLATVLVARIINPAGPAAGTEDKHWADLLDRHHSFVKKEIELFKGRTVEIGSERMLATFDGPARAIRAACAITDAARRLGLKLQSGLHTGECDVMGDQVSGVAVEIASEVAAQSASGEVLVSSTVKDLVAGSGIGFGERGTHSLTDGSKNNLGEWQLFAVERGCAVM